MDNARGTIGRAVVHCFTGEKDELFDYLERDFYSASRAGSATSGAARI